MNTLPGTQKNTNSPEQEFPVPGNGGNQGNSAEEDLLAPKDDDHSDLDDALDDDNENPVGQTLIDASENTGPAATYETRELEGEVDEDGQE